MPKTNKSLSPFHNRLKGILEKDVPGWAKKLDVNENTIRYRWFEGSYPGTDNLIKIIEETGISAQELLFGDLGNVYQINNVIPVKEKYPQFYEILDKVIASDKADAAVAAMSAYLKGVMSMLGETGEQTKLLRELNEKMERLLETLTRPTKQRKEPAPGSG